MSKKQTRENMRRHFEKQQRGKPHPPGTLRRFFEHQQAAGVVAPELGFNDDTGELIYPNVQVRQEHLLRYVFLCEDAQPLDDQRIAELVSWGWEEAGLKEIRDMGGQWSPAHHGVVFPGQVEIDGFDDVAGPGS